MVLCPYQIELHRLNLFVLLFRSKRKEDQESTRLEPTMIPIISIIEGSIKIKTKKMLLEREKN